MWQIFENLNSYEIARIYFHQLLDETSKINELLIEDNLKQYMSTLGRLVTDKKDSYIFEYHYANRLQDVISIILTEDLPVVLDAGCGLGTESLLFGLLGAKVL